MEQIKTILKKNQTLSETKESVENCLPPSAEGLNYLWARMIVKYNELWISRSGEFPYKNKNLTAQGSEWSDQLKGLKRNDIEQGFKKLTDSDYIKYPPNAMSFRDLCTENDQEGVLDAIMCKLQEGAGYQWTNQLAFNFWTRYSFDLLSMKNYEVPRLVKQNIRLFDKNSLVPIPDYTVKALTSDLKEKDDKPPSKKIKDKYLAKMKANLGM